MDAAIRALKSFSPSHPDASPSAKPYDAAVRSYVQTLEQLSDDEREAILLDPVQFLSLLDPAENSIGYLAVINLLLSGTKEQLTVDRSFVLDKTLDFLLKFDPYQIRYSGSSFRNLLEEVASGSLFSPLVAVELLASAILRIDPRGSMFTSTHLIMAKLAYDANCIGPALKVIDSSITFYPCASRSSESNERLYEKDLEPAAYISETTGLTSKVNSTSVLEYHLLRALIYMSERDWPKTQTALEQVITHPVKDKAISKIMVDSHKKWVLVGLLNQGKAPNVPSGTSQTAKHIYSVLNHHYNNMASLFITNNASELMALVENESRTWQDDGNMTLVAEVLAAYQKWQIINLRQIYRQMSISQIRQMTLSAETGEGLKTDEEVLSLVTGMIESGMLKGELQVGPTGNKSYLTFHDDYDEMTEGDFAMAIAGCHHRIEMLSAQYRQVSDRLGSSKEWARHLAREQKRVEKEEPDAGFGFDTQIEDEDLMTGVLSHA